jgi:hypothetical protein
MIINDDTDDSDINSRDDKGHDQHAFYVFVVTIIELYRNGTLMHIGIIGDFEVE